MLLSLTLVATLLAVAAAYPDAADTKPEHAEDAKPAGQPSLTALQLPSESLFRAARTAVRAARALADNMPSECLTDFVPSHTFYPNVSGAFPTVSLVVIQQKRQPSF